MDQTEAELELLATLAPVLNAQLGRLLVWGFTASIMPDNNWVARMDYTLEGESDLCRSMKSLLLEGRGIKVHRAQRMRPRTFRMLPSEDLLRIAMIMTEIESPEPGERIV